MSSRRVRSIGRPLGSRDRAPNIRPKPFSPFHLDPSLAIVVAAAVVIFAIAPVTGASDDVAVLTGTAESAALSVEVESRCSDVKLRSPEAVVRWNVDTALAPKSDLATELTSAGEYRIDLSPFAEGIERGAFESMRVPEGSVADPTAYLDLPKGASHPSAGREMLVGDLQPGVTYRLRVLALTSQGWVASDQVMFRAAICPVDMDEDVEGGAR